MTPNYFFVRASVLAFAVYAMALSPGAAQTAKTIFCFTDGTKVGAERFETKDGKFLLYVPGAASPLEYPATKVCSVNVDPCNCVPAPQLPPNSGPAPISAAAQFGIHGSNTIGERLMPSLIEAYARKAYGAAPVTKLGKPEEMEITLVNGSAAKAVIDFQSHGSGTAAKGLAEGKAQIGMASRQLKQQEADLLKQTLNIDAYAQENEHVLALDGLAVIVNPQNPVRKLTLEQIGRVFAGQITNWRDVGGADLPIVLYRRDDKSGTFDTFKSLVLDPLNLKISPEAKKFESSELLVEGAGKDPGGIGFIALPYVGKGNRALDIDSACGLTSSATRFAVKSEEYPLARRLFLYTAGTPSVAEASNILRFALSDDAQPIIADNEFVSLAIEFQPPQAQQDWAKSVQDKPTLGLGTDKTIPSTPLRGFAQAMTHMRRTTMEFRFRHASADLDNRALQDIERLARYLTAPENSRRKFLLVGFADSDGGWATNDDLAARRAESVARLLVQQNVSVPRANIKSLSYLAPVACNDDDAGKAKNRRVEVWIE
ncbi:substrate-binding domain-containing protein [Methylocapsa acidiphila]|uniref:substrate-binding domain-containing protein n=1 Tax=Methylocapsa acidiphila TaxID=133552 RepID=UPI000417BAB2|nr:phosphate ABC transporter substrate-binding/OmpA family protein [Methylocapsa acidiphila]